MTIILLCLKCLLSIDYCLLMVELLLSCLFNIVCRKTVVGNVIYLLLCTASAILCTKFSCQGEELSKHLVSVPIPKRVLYVFVFMLIVKLK